MNDDLKIFEALHSQIERLDIIAVGVSPNERKLANAILVILNVLIDKEKRIKD